MHSLATILLTLSALATLVPAAASAASYRVDSAASDIHWRIYRSGALANLGHNHVISATQFQGSVELAKPPQKSRFLLEIPAAALRVDDPRLRRHYGREFAEPIPADAVSATRANMLGPKLLNAGNFPIIRLRGEALVDNPPKKGNLTFATTMDIAGRRLRILLPARIVIAEDSIRATGQFTLSHQQLGLQPFSAALGTLKVSPQIDFSFSIVARRR
ncbi:YceI family protein [Microbulbifer sp. 2201CG32-9]|uniref:YceI family protein n=1 Tax=Microbulbifer sp. 2201CG32-9 TaxID=3232309 RepID=UPI00345C0E7A